MDWENLWLKLWIYLFIFFPRHTPIPFPPPPYLRTPVRSAIVHREPRWAGGGGGGGDRQTMYVGWPREQRVLALTWQGWGWQYKMYKSIIFMNFISRSKKWNQKVKVVNNAFLVSISCWDFDILLVSSLSIFGSAVEEALQGHSFF
jgi:hypothetical protein